MDYHLQNKDEKGFEIAYLQTKQFYFDYEYVVESNPRKEYFCGLYLLHLLSNNRNSEYCSELELLSLNNFNNDYIKLPIEIEHSISEGNYNKLIALQNAITEGSYLFYLGKLNSSIRYQIARSAEKSFNSISVKDLCELLMFNSANELLDFINNENEKYEGNERVNWILKDNSVVFTEGIGHERIVIPSNKLVTETLKLAVEMEKII